MAKGQIKARIHCTVEVPVGVWSGGKTDLEALTEQVRREGREIVRKMVEKEQGCVVGTPRVFFIVLHENEKGESI